MKNGQYPAAYQFRLPGTGLYEPCRVKNIDVPESEGKPKAEEESRSCVIGGQIVTLSGKEASENHQEKIRVIKLQDPFDIDALFSDENKAPVES